MFDLNSWADQFLPAFPWQKKEKIINLRKSGKQATEKVQAAVVARLWVFYLNIKFSDAEASERYQMQSTDQPVTTFSFPLKHF